VRKNRDKIKWKLITDLPVQSRDDAIEKLNWRSMAIVDSNYPERSRLAVCGEHNSSAASIKCGIVRAGSAGAPFAPHRVSKHRTFASSAACRPAWRHPAARERNHAHSIACSMRSASSSAP
jgi:hypothetical protein